MAGAAEAQNDQPTNPSNYRAYLCLNFSGHSILLLLLARALGGRPARQLASCLSLRGQLCRSMGQENAVKSDEHLGISLAVSAWTWNDLLQDPTLNAFHWQFLGC